MLQIRQRGTASLDLLEYRMLSSQLSTAQRKKTMNDQDRARERDHWQAIAEQLGLSSDQGKPGPQPSAGEASAPARPEPAIREPAEAKHEAPASEKAHPERDSGPEHPPLEEGQPRQSRSPERRGRERGGEGGGERGRGDRRGGQHPSNRGRGRRGGKTPREQEDQGSEPQSDLEASPVLELSPVEESEPNKKEGPPRRGRGRGRGDKRVGREDVESPRTRKAIPQAEQAPAEPEDNDLEDLPNLSTLNVPSWNELIASLYRPER